MTDNSKFKNIVWDHYNQNYRTMPWRQDTNEYYVMVSEIMLQQTQVNRVLQKFPSFIERFPNIDSLACAELSEVLEEWLGLGYNRRAKFLKQAAEVISNNYNGNFPSTVDNWMQFPGFGKNTASAVLVYSRNFPLVFIETNIRTVFIHHFFPEKQSVSDKEIEYYVNQTLDLTNPREWYWALMDYGTYLKKEFGNDSKKAAVYSKQSKFEGSFRQKRAAVLRFIVKNKMTTDEEIFGKFMFSNDIFEKVIQSLVDDEFIESRNGNYFVK